MSKETPTLCSVMSISINDPSGALGIQADIEAISAMGGHCTSVISGLAIKNTADLHMVTPLPSHMFWHQAKTILEDMPISAIKIGFLGSIDNVQVAYNLLKDYPNIPLILSPNLALLPNQQTHNQNVIDAVFDLLIPMSKVCILQDNEARWLGQQADTVEACAHSIMAQGADYVLITGHKTREHPFVNTLYGHLRRLDTAHWDHHPYEFQGINCTLSSSLAALLAQDLTMTAAVRQAQAYTEKCLKFGYRLGMGHPLLNRLFWARESIHNEDHKKFNQ